MKTLQLRNAKASLSSVVDDAMAGEPTTITRHGIPAAVVVPVAMAERLFPKKSFVDHLLSLPEPIEFDRDELPLEEIEF